MRRDDYWNLFWMSGMPEAWLLSRPMEPSLLFPGLSDELAERGEDLPREVREHREKQSELAGPEATHSFPAE